MNKSRKPFEKISAFPKNAKPLLFQGKGILYFIIVFYFLMGLGFICFISLGLSGRFEFPVISAILLMLLTLVPLVFASRNLYRLVTNKMICLARDDEWLYLDELDPRRIKIADIQEAIIITKSIGNAQRIEFLEFKMKDNTTTERLNVTWWHLDNLYATLVQLEIPVTEISKGPFDFS